MYLYAVRVSLMNDWMCRCVYNRLTVLYCTVLYCTIWNDMIYYFVCTAVPYCTVWLCEWLYEETNKWRMNEWMNVLNNNSAESIWLYNTVCLFCTVLLYSTVQYLKVAATALFCIGVRASLNATSEHSCYSGYFRTSYRSHDNKTLLLYCTVLYCTVLCCTVLYAYWVLCMKFWFWYKSDTTVLIYTYLLCLW